MQQENNDLRSVAPVAHALEKIVPPSRLNADDSMRFEFDFGELTDEQSVPARALDTGTPSLFNEAVMTAGILAAVAMPGARAQLSARLLKQADTAAADDGNPIMSALKGLLMPPRRAAIELNIDTDDIYYFMTQNGIEKIVDMHAIATIVVSAWRYRRDLIEKETAAVKDGIIKLQVRPQGYDILLPFEKLRIVDRYWKLKHLVNDLNDCVFYCMCLIVPENVFGVDYDLLGLAAELRNSKFDGIAALFECLCESEVLGIKLPSLLQQYDVQQLESIGDELKSMAVELAEIPLLALNYENTIEGFNHYIRNYAKNGKRCPKPQAIVEEVAIQKPNTSLISHINTLKWLPWLVPVLVTWIYSTIMSDGPSRFTFIQQSCLYLFELISYLHSM